MIGLEKLSIRKYKDDLYYIGVQVQKQNGETYFTQKSVRLPYHIMKNLKIAAQILRTKQNALVRLKGTDVLLKKDIYKGKEFYGLRHYVWYADQPQVTRYGINMTPQQMKSLLFMIQRS